jgi:uncharacterized protein (TIGR03435 family)
LRGGESGPGKGRQTPAARPPALPELSLARVFDIHLELSFADLGYPDVPPGSPAPFTPTDGTAISIAVQKLGLQLRPAKGSGEFLVIDHVEKPSGN